MTTPKKERPLSWYDFKVKLSVSALTLGFLWNLFGCPTWVLLDGSLFTQTWKVITLASANIILAIVIFFVLTPKTSFLKAKLFGGYRSFMAFLSMTMLGVTLYAMYLNTMPVIQQIQDLLNVNLVIIAVVSVLIGIFYAIDWALFKVPSMNSRKATENEEA